MSKLLEKAVHHQLHHFLSKLKVMSPFQCGFRNTFYRDCCYSFLRICAERNELRSTYRCCFYRPKEAFDSVDHNLMVKKLETYGLLDNDLFWFCSYLSERRQVVSIGMILALPVLRIVRPLSYHLRSPTRIHIGPIDVCVTY